METVSTNPSSTGRGDAFEIEMVAAFQELIMERRYFLPPECCSIFHKKGYYSKDREKEIIFDVSIEVRLPGRSDYSLLVLIECKNYSHRVPVDDIEEFFAKTEQITPGKTKAIVASTNAFQEGAFAFARSKGIGLMRYLGKERLEIILDRSPSSMPMPAANDSPLSAYRALRDNDFTSRWFDFFCYWSDIYTILPHLFLTQIAKSIDDPGSIIAALDDAAVATSAETVVPFRKSREIEALSIALLQDAQYSAGEVPLDSICEQLKATMGLRVVRTALPPDVLGRITFAPPVIELNDEQSENRKRERFTLAHELGHLVLGHAEFMEQDVCRSADLDLDQPPKIGVRDIERMEWQANYFASCLLLPKQPFLQSVARLAKINNLFDRGHGLVYLDNQPCNIHQFSALAAPLMGEFCVSRSVIQRRMKTLGLLVDGSGATGGLSDSLHRIAD